MFKPVELFVGLRYLRAKRRNHFISFISMISMGGIALGIWSLITVLSVMNGFELELRDRALVMASHIQVQSKAQVVKDWDRLAQQLGEDRRIVGTAPFVAGEALIANENRGYGSVVRGILPDREAQVSPIEDKLLLGSLEQLQPRSFGIVIGIELASRLRVSLGDKVTVVIPKAQMTPGGLVPRFRKFTIVGLFEVGMHEYDSALALIHMQDAAKLYRVRDGVSGVRLKLTEVMDAPAIARQLDSSLESELYAMDWTQQHSSLFQAIKMEQKVMFVILFLIVAVAAFNIISTLVMVVTDKQADIAILRTMGASPNSVMAVFMVQGSVIGIIGTLVGALTGIPTAIYVNSVVTFLEGLFGVRVLSPEVYYITELVSDIHWDQVFLICFVSLLMSFVVTVYPAWRAARTVPAEALRYE